MSFEKRRRISRKLPRSRFLIYLLLPILLTQPSSLAETCRPIVVETAVIDGSPKAPSRKLYVSIGNQMSLPLESMQITVETASGEKSISMPSPLSALQWQTASVDISKEDHSEILLLVRYRVAGQDNAIMKTVPVNQSDRDGVGGLFEVLLPALLGMMGVLSGVALTAYLTARREIRQAKSEWSKLLFQTYQIHYRLFFQRVSGTMSLSLIERYFDDLKSSALVTPKMQGLMDELRAELGAETDANKQQTSRDEFLEKFIRLIVGEAGQEFC